MSLVLSTKVRRDLSQNEHLGLTLDIGNMVGSLLTSKLHKNCSEE